MKVILATILVVLIASPAFSATKKQSSARMAYASAHTTNYDPDSFIRNSMSREQMLQPY